MFFDISIAALMLVVTAAIHASFMILVLKLVRPFERIEWNVSFLFRFANVTAAILLMFCASVLEGLAWAATYLWLGVFSQIEPALYFSMVTFTSLGFGDIVLGEQWRLLASFQAANGIILFGWTTAIAFAVLRNIYISRWNREEMTR